jgi:hypothetical protein
MLIKQESYEENKCRILRREIRDLFPIRVSRILRREIRDLLPIRVRRILGNEIRDLFPIRVRINIYVLYFPYLIISI